MFEDVQSDTVDTAEFRIEILHNPDSLMYRGGLVFQRCLLVWSVTDVIVGG